MAKKKTRAGIDHGPVEVNDLLRLTAAVLKLQTMLFDALLTLPQNLDVPVSAAWRKEFGSPISIKIGRGCDCVSPLFSRSIKIGKGCDCSAAAVTRSIKIGKAC
jgi:hypothetical protein